MVVIVPSLCLAFHVAIKQADAVEVPLAVSPAAGGTATASAVSVMHPADLSVIVHEDGTGAREGLAAGGTQTAQPAVGLHPALRSSSKMCHCIPRASNQDLFGATQVTVSRAAAVTVLPPPALLGRVVLCINHSSGITRDGVVVSIRVLGGRHGTSCWNVLFPAYVFYRTNKSFVSHRTYWLYSRRGRGRFPAF